MFVGHSSVKSAWIAVEVTREGTEKVLVVEAYMPVSSLEANFDAARYQQLVDDIRAVLERNPDIDRASILSMHKDKACSSLFRRITGDHPMPMRRSDQPLHA